ncbi:MAG TPA: PAS domain S-box protein, partial [Phycisphaerae bacterium]|nr:PAS domain S-box protein [Phycisphaerae bacterium]
DTVAPALVRAFAEDALRASEERYQAVVDDQTDVLCRFRPDGTFVFVNEACCRLFGKSKAELLGNTCASVVHPDYLDRVGAELASLSPSNPVAVIENGILAADGNVRWMQFVNRGLFDAHGNLVEIQAVGRDLTERKRVEDLLRQERDRAQHYLDIAEVMFVAIDTQENVTLINKKGCEILRCAEEEVLGRNWFDHFVPAPERERTRAVFARLIAGEVAPARYYQNAVLTRDGRTRMMAWHNTVVRDASGRIVGTLSSGEDITERLRAEEEARQRQAELAHVLRVSTVGAMASSLAHELSQPLTAVTSYLRGCQRRLRDGKMDLESLGRAIASAIEQAERAGEIVQTVRTFLQRGEVRRTRVDLNRVVRGAVTLVAAEADRQGIAVRLALCPELPPTSANPVQIEQVILNLIRNGLEAMSQVAGAARELRIETAVSENGGLEVAVADSGPGLGVEDPDRIFSPFFTTKPEGLGMGLSISRTIVEAHGGRLWMTPNGEGGCTFRFTLPAVTHER